VTALPDFVEPSDLEDFRSSDPDSILRQAQGAIRRYCGWHIAPEVTDTITLDGNGTRVLALPSGYVTDVEAITNEGTALTTEDFDWSESGYVHHRTGWWTDRPRQVVVTLTHGYPDIPDELIGVASSLASRRASSPAGYKRETTGPFSVEHGGREFLRDELDVLDKFKLPPRP
jgi:hypothetical protein